MAIRNYQWSAALTVDSGGYQGETITIEQNGVVLYSGSVSNPPETFTGATFVSTSETGSATYTYTYLDSDFGDNSRAQKVWITATDSWTVSINNTTNIMTVTVNTVINSITRTLAGASSTWKRKIWVRRSPSGADFPPFPLEDTPDSPHTIAENVNLGSYTFSLAPGGGTEKSSIWYRSTTYDHVTDPIPNKYTDLMFVGIHFKNILPPPTTYRMTYDANGGTGAPAQQTATTAEGSYTFTVPSGSPTWGSYKFLGWSRTQYSRTCTDADVEYRAGDTITLQEANPTLTLYACWEKDYRPGKIIDNGGIWQSHNRPTGADNILTNSNWRTMRTIDGAVGTDNPPYMMHPSEFKNQRKIGNNA